MTVVKRGKMHMVDLLLNQKADLEAQDNVREDEMFLLRCIKWGLETITCFPDGRNAHKCH